MCFVLFVLYKAFGLLQDPRAIGIQTFCALKNANYSESQLYNLKNLTKLVSKIFNYISKDNICHPNNH